ncbi:uncharacterized protein LOC136030151 isoform X2 [Artemia franciscana]|uniref:uncharacterized protein LOC136030151 isoform X2 n=1 Tax=Artemia franciscana TaxID=6661 RepID=UPI0032DA20E8
MKEDISQPNLTIVLDSLERKFGDVCGRLEAGFAKFACSDSPPQWFLQYIEANKLCPTFENQTPHSSYFFNHDKAAESDKQQSFKFEPSEQQAKETLLQRVLTELEVTKGELIKLQIQSSKHTEEISKLNKKYWDLQQVLEEKETISMKFSPERSPEKNEGAAELVAEVEDSLNEDLKPVQGHLSATTKDKDSFLSKTVARETSSREERDVDISPTEDQIVQREEEGNYTDRVDLLSASFATSAIGEWETHTKGFGSKMMAKLGYVMGSGLGKNGEGRTEPVECILLPRGKSLDHCMEIKQKALRKPNKKAKKNRLRQQNIIAEKQENKCVEVQAGDEDHFQVSLDVSNTRTSFGIQDNQMMEAPTRSLDSEKKEIRIDIDPIPGHMEEKLWNRKISQLEESVLNQKAFDLPLNMSMEAKSGIVATEPALSESNTRAIKFNQTNIKAVEEQTHTPKYAEVSKLMFEIEIPSVSGTGIVRFRKLLLDRCHQTFEKLKKLKEEIISKQKAQLEADTEEKKTEIQMELNKRKGKLKHIMIGNLSFFGELFKLKIVTVENVNFCISELLKSPTEEQLECLSKFISIIGKTYEEEYDANYQRAVADVGSSEKQIHIQLTKLDIYLDEMKELSRREDLSSRIRFMLMQVLDLKKNHWDPHREGDVFTEVG